MQRCDAASTLGIMPPEITRIRTQGVRFRQRQFGISAGLFVPQDAGDYRSS
jgi:hypothetical protein